MPEERLPQKGSHLVTNVSHGLHLTLDERVIKGDCKNGVAIVRPPGHHAEAHCCKGFCVFNNVAVAAAVARKKWGVKRVLIVDWDGEITPTWMSNP